MYTPLLNSSYFEAELNIGQVHQIEVSDELALFIQRYEYDFFLKLMGKSLFDAFYLGMNQSTIEDRFKLIAFGSYFLLDVSKVQFGIKIDSLYRYRNIPDDNYIDKMPVNFKGLLKDDGVYGSTSPVAKYVYYYWMRSHNTVSGGVGESKQQAHGGHTVTNNVKMTTFYNELCQDVLDFYYFLDMNIADYPEFDLPVNGRWCPVRINQFNIL